MIVQGPSQLGLNFLSSNVRRSTRSPFFEYFGHDYFFPCRDAQRWCSIIRIATMSLLASCSSNARAISVVLPMRRMSKPNSMGISSSALKARAYGVSPVGCLGIVRWAQRATGSSSTHLPLVEVNRFLM